MWQEQGVVGEKYVWAALCLVSVMASAVSAHADPKAAEAVFQAGKDAMARGDLATACARFQESFRLDAAPGTLLNVGECEQKRGHVATAWQAFHDAMALLPAGDFRMTYAEEHAAQLAPKIPSVRILVDARARSPRVSLDGVELGAPSLGVALPIDPGDHVVVVRAEGQAQTETSFRIAEADKRDLAIAAGKEVTDAVAPPRDGAPNGGRKAATFAAFGVGFAGVFTGAVTGLLAMNEAARYRGHCDNTGCDEDGLDAASKGRSLSTISTIGFGAGAVGLGVGAILLATAPASKSSTRAQAYAAPSISPSGGSLTVGGRF
jgi:hypothetical protein